MDAVQANGDVAFHVSLNDCSLDKKDCLNPIMRTRFFVDFIGEFLVRENIESFANILTGLDNALYQKMICTCRHTDFGMIIDQEITIMTFQMHMSLVQEILTEEFGTIDMEYGNAGPFEPLDEDQENGDEEPEKGSDDEDFILP